VSRYDAIMVGVGGMGSGVLYHLARHGIKALGVERYDIPHELGSSHGTNLALDGGSLFDLTLFRLRRFDPRF
jgi:glycine/D-amino acid oxidase-like deaminating enzyme